MPTASHEKRDHDRPPEQTERLPQWRLNHRHEERRKKERYGCEDGALPRYVLAAVSFQNLINDPVPSRLHLARTLSVWVVRMQDRCCGLCAFIELLVVKCALLRID